MIDGIAAKKVLLALARKLGAKSIRRANSGHDKYQLKLVSSTGKNRPLLVCTADAQFYDKLDAPSANWGNILKALEGKWISAYKPIYVSSIEQLAIDLEVEGWLKLK